MKLFIKNIPGLQLPKQANPGEDAAFDIFATTPPNIVGTKINRSIDNMAIWSKVGYIEYGTNIYCAPETELGAANEVLHTYHTELFPRSSISAKNLILANSVATIDSGYRGQIFLRFKYYFQPENYVVLQEAGGLKVYGIIDNDTIYGKGEKIVQLKVRKDIPVEIVLVEILPISNRKAGGFGSSGK